MQEKLYERRYFIKAAMAKITKTNNSNMPMAAPNPIPPKPFIIIVLPVSG